VLAIERLDFEKAARGSIDRFYLFNATRVSRVARASGRHLSLSRLLITRVSALARASLRLEKSSTIDDVASAERALEPRRRTIISH